MATSPRSMSQALAEEYRNQIMVPQISQTPVETYTQPGSGTGVMQSPIMGSRSSDPTMNAIVGALLGAAGEMIYKKAAGASAPTTPKTPNTPKTPTTPPKGGGSSGDGDQLPTGPLIPGEDLEKEFPYDIPMPDEILDLEDTGDIDIGDFEGIDLSGGSAGNYLKNPFDDITFDGIDMSGGSASNVADVYEVPGTTIDITDELTGNKSQAVYPGSNIGDVIEITPDFDFSEWLDLGDGAFKGPDGDIYVDESFIRDLNLGNLFNNFDFSNYDFGGSYGPSYDWSDYGSYGFKDGGMATPLMSKGGYPRFDDGGGVDIGMSYGDDVPTTTSTNTSSSGSSADWLSSLLSGLTKGATDLFSADGTKGALLGALLASLAGKSGGSSQVNQGFDWSKIGIPSRTTDFGTGPAKFVPYQQYQSVPNVPDIYEKSDLYSSLGAPAYESAGASPLRYSAMDIYKPSFDAQLPTVFPKSPLSYNLADGGGVDTSYYTYGKPVDPMEKLAAIQQMRDGGRTDETAGVPEVDGRFDYRQGARVSGEGDGQSDDIPAWLAEGEYVIDSETVAQLGNGSTKAGSDLLDKFREEIRKHKRSADHDEIPPPSKSPMQYLAMAGKKVGKGKKNG